MNFNGLGVNEIRARFRETRERNNRLFAALDELDNLASVTIELSDGSEIEITKDDLSRYRTRL